ncbi:MAG: ABC transporter substrate-binding protein, partial [Candidatus Tectomicrobia bacterium]|nr:ABC transporter substrate-binding protein [Candidatus Tectomicrobia bacterium]
MGPSIMMRKWMAIPAMVFCLLVAVVTEPAAQGLTKVPVSYTTISGQQAIMRVVKDAGIFEKNGLDVTLIYMGTGSAIQALMAKESPVIVASGVQPVNANLRGTDVVVFINLADKLDYIFFGGKGIKEGKDLVGGRVAITRFGALSEFGALYAVRQLGLRPTDVTMVQIGGQPDRFAALEAGAAQATVL